MGDSSPGRSRVQLMSTATYALVRAPLRQRLAYQLRVLRVMASVDFKLKYVDSALGYVWSLAKPLSYFAVLWIVFGRFFNTGIAHFPAYLLIGIVLFTFLTDAVGSAQPSLVTRGPLLRRIAFPPILIPLSATVTAAMTFGVNLVAAAGFTFASGITPKWDWFLIILLLLELYVFVLGLAVMIATFFVRLRDIGPIWELCAQLLLFASPIMYPIGILPAWAERVAVLNPFVQVIEDVRALVLGVPSTVNGILGGAERRVVPLSIALGSFLFALWLYRRESPRFAELA